MPSRSSARSPFVATLVFLGIAASACTGSVDISFGSESPADAAVDLIEGEAMAQRLEVSAITDTVCEDPVDEEVGTTFDCTAQSDGQTIFFEVLLEEDDRIFAGPTNVLVSASLAQLEPAAVQALNRENGFDLAEDSLDCGDGAVILDSEMQMTCALVNPADGVIFDVLVTVSDTNTGAFTVVIVGEAE